MRRRAQAWKEIVNAFAKVLVKEGHGTAMPFFALLCAGAALAGIVESLMHNRRLLEIPVRIHVNGTRGKSTTARLIAAGLRAAGHRVIAKTTGTASRIIWEDGSEETLRKRSSGRTSIAEQMRVAAIAARRGADALVLECMALEPENQWVSEHRMIRSTIGVVTNVREDHLDIMGPGARDVARILSLTVPHRGCLVTSERDLTGILEERARAMGSSVYVVDGSEVPDEVNDAFPYVSFKENVACALRVCELVGVPREVAISGMLAARGDPGVMRTLEIKRASGPYVLVNAFAANDCTSTLLAWRAFAEEPAMRDSCSRLPVVAVVNNRADRVQRLRELSVLVAKEIRPRHVFLIGEAGRVGKAQLVRSGIEPDRVTDLTAVRDPERLLGAIESSAPGGAVLCAVGNTKGMGQRLAEFFERNGEVL